MRAPGEASGLMALEIAMDEMAEKLNIDPVEFRVHNDTQVDPANARSARFPSAGWFNACAMAPSASVGSNARHRPDRRDGRWLVGMGVAAAFRNNLLTEIGRARPARQARHGHGRNRHDRHRHRQLHHHCADRCRDHGRVARTGRGAPGRFFYPVSAGSGGQWGANNSTSGVFAACMKLREAVARSWACRLADVPVLGRHGQCRRPLGAVGTSGGSEGLVGRRRHRVRRPGQEVSAVHLRCALRRGRRRCVSPARSACGACWRCAPPGRILNPKSARSQVIGAMTMGVGGA
jgi:xanthine dehydrogenase YagR molybdenum-binding subunit